MIKISKVVCSSDQQSFAFPLFVLDFCKVFSSVSAIMEHIQQFLSCDWQNHINVRAVLMKLNIKRCSLVIIYLSRGRWKLFNLCTLGDFGQKCSFSRSQKGKHWNNREGEKWRVKICFTRSLYSVNKCKNAVCVMNHDDGMANQSKTLLNQGSKTN